MKQRTATRVRVAVGLDTVVWRAHVACIGPEESRER